MLKLFGHDASPYVRRVRVVLAELRIPFERDTHGWQDPAAEFVDASPIQRVPMLDLGPGSTVRHVFESRVITALLYSLPHPRPEGDPPFQDVLLDPSLALLDQNVISVADAAQDSLVNLFLLEPDGIRPEQASYLRRQVARARGCLDWLERTYRGKRTLASSERHLLGRATNGDRCSVPSPARTVDTARPSSPEARGEDTATRSGCAACMQGAGRAVRQPAHCLGPRSWSGRRARVTERGTEQRPGRLRPSHSAGCQAGRVETMLGRAACAASIASSSGHGARSRRFRNRIHPSRVITATSA